MEIMYKNERDNRMAWILGARVLEAIGVAFSKNKRYSAEPRLKTKAELNSEQEQAFKDFAEKAKIMFKGKGK